MPFGEDFLSDRDMSPPLIQSDLLNDVEPEYPAADGVGDGAGPTVVTLDDQPGLNEGAAGIPEADMDIQAELEAEANAAMSAPPSTIKKRGRPSLGASATPAKSVASRTPHSTKSAGRSTGKRKSAEAEVEPEEEDEAEPTPARKRGRPGRATGAAASARLAAKAANKPTRGRPKSTATAAKPAKKAGRPSKATNGTLAADEYEVEDIVDSAIDADTMEHMYLVKWKNYPASENTWEPKKNLSGSLDLVRKFDAKKKKEEAALAAKRVTAKKASTAAAGAASGGEENKPAARRGRKPKAVKAVKPAKKAPGRPAGRRRRARA